MFFRRRRREREFDSEIQYHLDRVTKDYLDRGLDPKEARRRARLEFGGAAQIAEDLRDVHRARWLSDLRQDLGYALRSLRRSPGFLVCAVATLALGIGANTAIFSLIDALMLRPLAAVRDPGSLVQVVRQSDGCNTCAVSYPLFEYFRDRLTTISGSFAAMPIRHEITVDGIDEMTNGEEVSGGYYSVLGLAPAAGRLLGPADDAAPTPVAVISYDYWRRRFALDPAAIGKSFVYASTALTIVGVEPPGFEGTERWRTYDFTVPLSMSDQLAGGTGSEWRRQRDNNFFEVMARVKPGATPTQANAEVLTLFEAWRNAEAAGISDAFERARFLKGRAAALPGLAGMNGLRFQFQRPLAILMGIVGLVLLLACANLSGLLLARAASRQREISVRRALGAGQGRLIRQFLAESLLLAAGGGVAGFVAAQWFSRSLVAMMANGDELPLNVAPDWRVLAFTGAMALLACVLAGLAPGWSAGKVNFHPELQVRGGSARRLGGLMVVAQVAISMTLLVGASLFVHSLVKLYSVDTGIHAGGVFTFAVTSKHHFPPARGAAIQQAIVERMQSLPGVVAASAANVLPLGGGLWSQAVEVEGYTFRPGEENGAACNAIAPRYFAVTGTPLVLGRDFNDRDAVGSTPAVIVNQEFVRAFFAGRSPLGRHVSAGEVTYEIVGVAKDAKYESLRKSAPRTMYIPWARAGKALEQPMQFTFLARVSGGDPMRLAPLMERTVREVDSAMRLRTPQTFADHVSRGTLNERMLATLGGFFGLLALLVACLGIFGLMAFQVARRRSEIGVRMALGATRGDIRRLVLREAAALLLPGCVVGALAAAGLARFADAMLFGVDPLDPAAFALAAAALGMAALAAAYLPALRAARVEPMTALRCE